MTTQHRAALLRSALCVTTAKPRPTPTLFFFPGLESKPWHNANRFQALHQLEVHRDTIQREYLALRDLRKANTAATAASDYNVNDKEHQLHQGEWDWLSYVTQGRRQSEFAAHCPKTVEILESIPGFMTGLPFAYSFFSVLKPQSSIKAHSAPCNIRLRCHFPLFVPDGCGIRVGDETRQWETGKPITRMTMRSGTKARRATACCCSLTFWHPDLEQEERESITRMFEEAKEKGWLQDSK
uniref:Aspartyl/asparaginy/proline hydroxylase domain-containing protein n=1 Tax=Globisporangium ultimum (strain ATCC 200006 / CBS 805.95 / DAOM BR144) TaxID=431595 RepID=K3WIT0_GLOUD